jgi:hypothetical protein
MASTEPVAANNNKKIFFILGGLILLIVIIILIVKSSKKSQDAADVQAQMLLLQQQHQDPNTPASQKQTIASQIANLATLLAQIKAGKTGTPPLVPTTTTTSDVTWTPISSSSGVCKNPASLNKDLLLKSGSINGEVCALQSYLNSQKSAGLVNDGNFGPKTGSALLAATGKSSITLKELIG